MKRLFFLLLSLPLFLLAQQNREKTTISFSMESERTILQSQEMDYTEAGDVFFYPLSENRRMTSVSLTIVQLISSYPGAYGFWLRLNYQKYDDRSIGTHPEFGSFDYTRSTEVIIPCLGFRYFLLALEGLKVSANMGGHLQLQTIYHALNETDIEIQNSLQPFLGAKAHIELFQGLLSLNPYINYQISPIYFDDINEINTENINEAIQAEFTGWVTGISLSLNLAID